MVTSEHEELIARLRLVGQDEHLALDRVPPAAPEAPPALQPLRTPAAEGEMRAKFDVRRWLHRLDRKQGGGLHSKQGREEHPARHGTARHDSNAAAILSQEFLRERSKPLTLNEGTQDVEAQ